MLTSLDMASQLRPMLKRYADLAVTGALNLQPGQRLLILGPLANGGVSLEAAPLVRAVAEAAYQAGARLVGSQRAELLPQHRERDFARRHLR